MSQILGQERPEGKCILAWKMSPVGGKEDKHPINALAKFMKLKKKLFLLQQSYLKDI